MKSPTAIIERRARALYARAVAAFHRKNVSATKQYCDWGRLSNAERERWRAQAIASLRSDESVLDELAREDRQRAREATI